MANENTRSFFSAAVLIPRRRWRLRTSQGYETYALSFDYGQRHRQELDAARKIAKSLAAKRTSHY